MECMCRNVAEGHSFVRTQIDLSKLDNQMLPEFELTYSISQTIASATTTDSSAANSNEEIGLGYNVTGYEASDMAYEIMIIMRRRSFRLGIAMMIFQIVQ